MEKLIRIHPEDNVLVSRAVIKVGEIITVAGKQLKAEITIGLGHKIASLDIQTNEHIIKYGVSIGSATSFIPAGSHIHLHNMKSDYIPTFTLDNDFTSDKK